MRFGVVLQADRHGPPLESLTRQALAAQAAGFDLLWLEEGGGAGPALLTAAAIGARTSVIRLLACVRVGAHPLEIAEGATVADNCSNGRLVLALSDAGEAGMMAETADVLLSAFAARPFRSNGTHWKIPANLPENEEAERQITVTPPPAQLELPLWLEGSGAPGLARSLALPYVTPDGAGPAVARAAWEETERVLGASARRLRRPAMYALQSDAERLIARLREEQLGWGMDVAIIRLDGALGDEARARAVHTIASRVRPRVTLHELPTGIEAHWRQTLV
jgi:alkanesulfonate monooxygenase SsuD/methylene tetrahydromethanopterin reductase-like flavin-dependent oxidoreductase (luciferase family)